MTTRTRLWILAAAALGLAACGDDDDNGSPAPPPAPPATCTPPATPTVTFAAQVHPILTTKCGTCHGTTWGSSNRATAYPAALAQVDPSSSATTAENSALIRKGDNRVAHAGGDALDPGEVTSISRWVQECAQNN